jgi:hypothetical protein
MPGRRENNELGCVVHQRAHKAAARELQELQLPAALPSQAEMVEERDSDCEAQWPLGLVVLEGTSAAEALTPRF